MDQPWIVVLAGGEGCRIRSMTLAPDGTPVPKQFCRLRDGMSLFHRAVARGLALTRGARIVPVVRADHRRWWERDLRGLSPEILVAQRECRGTAHAVHRAIEEVASRDPDATILILPSDHAVDDETRFRSAAARICLEAEAAPDRLILLGIASKEPDPEYGWILPSTVGENGARRVLSFIEKPKREQAAALIRRGALINALVVAARARSFLGLFDLCLPDLVEARRAPGAGHDRRSWDFSRDFLSHTTAWQRVLAVTGCGWCDLGTPERLRRWMEQHDEFFWWEQPARSARGATWGPRKAVRIGEATASH
ncbi:MAG TPA: sugar phosphate nucleotidyltransferase [Candidatus Eisenbacteria bacterium]